VRSRRAAISITDSSSTSFRMTTLRWRVGSSANRDTAVLTASLRINISKGPVGNVRGGVDRFGHAHLPATQQVERAVMSDPEQPGSKRWRLLQILQRHECPNERVLHDVLAVE
jgi:hypothetical protein